MITRDSVLEQAVDQCMKELYSLVQPKVEWEEFEKECEIYTKKYRKWERYNHLLHQENLSEKELKEFSLYPENWKNASITECIGPRPFEFYFLPREIFKTVADNYIYAYRMDSKQDLLDTIQILKDYCKKPIVDKYIKPYTDEYENYHPGYRSYDHPDNLEKELAKLCEYLFPDGNPQADFNYYCKQSQKLQNKFFEFLDMAGKFFNWNRDLNSFNILVYLGPSPNSNKEAVIENWKKYRNKDIEINEGQMIKDYYGDDE